MVKIYGNNYGINFGNRTYLIWGSLGISLLLSTIQGLIYEKKREKRELEYHTERMKRLEDKLNN